MDSPRIMVCLLAILLISSLSVHDNLADLSSSSSTSARSCAGSTAVQSIDILPPGPVILSADEVQDFSFSLKDGSGNIISAGYEMGSNGGTTVQLGSEEFRFSPSGLGSASVWVCSGNVNKTVSITVVIGTVVGLELTASDIQVTADESIDLILERVDQQGYRQAIVVPTSNWTLPEGSVLEMLQGDGFRWTPNQDGNQSLIVEDGEFSAELEVHVTHGTARRLAISPSSPLDQITADDEIILNTMWEDIRGNRWPANSTWEIENTVIGLNSSIGASVLFDPSIQGLITISAEANDPITPAIIRTASISFVVQPGRLILLEISGHSLTIPVDVPFDLNPQGFDADGNAVDLTGLEWSIIEGSSPNSSINSDTNYFTPSMPGQHRIVATLGSRVTSATIEVEQGIPSSIEVRSDGDLALSVETGSELNLTVNGFDLAGSSYPFDVDWTVPEGFGVIEASSVGTGNFVYSAEGVGIVQLTASVGEVSWEILVSVLPGPPHSLEFDIKGELKQGNSVEVEVRAYDIANNKVTIAVCAVEFETDAGVMDCIEGRWILDLKAEGEVRLQGTYDEGYGLEYITIEPTLMDGLFGSDAGAVIFGGVIVLLMILGVLLAADRKTKEIIEERKLENQEVILQTPEIEATHAQPPVAPSPSIIQLESKSLSVENFSRPLMISEIPDSATKISPVQETDLSKWSDEQLLSAGWTNQQIESYRSDQLETSSNKADDVQEEWDTGW